jgi:hypothetical protein
MLINYLVKTRDTKSDGKTFLIEQTIKNIINICVSPIFIKKIFYYKATHYYYAL